MTRSTSAAWRLAPGHALALDRPRLVGIVNATPDSFSDGGAHGGTDELVAHARRLVEAGADVIDIGGESTRPGAERVVEGEQIARTAPVVSALRAVTDIPISIDTTRAAVAAAALDAGATIVNDVSAGTEDEALLPLVAARGAGLVLMHRLVAPPDDSYSDRYGEAPVYDDVVRTVREALVERAAAAEAAGVARDAIVLDPGLGFGKTVAQNFELIRRSAELASTGYPILGAASRKSFIGAASGVTDPTERDGPSAAAAVVQLLGGVRIFRVHDVAGHRRVLAVAEAARRGEATGTPEGGRTMVG